MFSAFLSDNSVSSTKEVPMMVHTYRGKNGSQWFLPKLVLIGNLFEMKIIIAL